MKQAEGKIISNREVKPGYFLMEIKAPSVAKKAKPGQFLTVRCGGAGTTRPLLRRPFGFHSISGPDFKILYEVVGGGTRILSFMKHGDKIDVLGPLGNGFTIPHKENNFILIAGGIGVAPLAALAEALVKKKKKNIYAIIGARAKKTLLCEDDFKDLGIKTFIATDDGSYGERALATDILNRLLVKMDAALPVIFACGPEAMLKSVSHISRKRGLECYASLEENIACGVGACLGCAVNTKAGYKLACKDGPVFNLKDIVW